VSTPVQHRSYSQINQLRTCSWQYKLERIDKIPSRPSCAAVAGRVVHKATESVDIAIVRGCTTRSALVEVALNVAAVDLGDEIQSHQEHYPDPDSWKRYGRSTVAKPKGEDIEWFRTDGIPACINSYVDWRLSTELVLSEIPGFGPAIEVPFVYNLGGQSVRGFIDRVFHHPSQPDNHLPLDIKSGLKPKTDEQLGLYAAALRETLGWTVEYGFYLYGLKKGPAQLTQPISLLHWTPEKLDSVYSPASRQIDAGIYIPHPGDSCYHCPVSAACEYAQAAI
jgi:putative RecB family exonuclease